MIQKIIPIENEFGLHARAAAKLVKLTTQFRSRVRLSRANLQQEIDGKSILGILLLAASQGTPIQVTVEGDDEEAAMEAITFLIANKFGEDR
ncbi:MAG: HPr family phosphocarrier protein [Acidobacteriota bacterium]